MSTTLTWPLRSILGRSLDGFDHQDIYRTDARLELQSKLLAQLEILLQIQDLKSQRRELAAGESARAMQEQAFHLDVDAAIGSLDENIGKMEAELDAGVRRRYERVARAQDRVVVPAIGGVCYGCFVSVATSVASDPAERLKLRNCDHCGRFLYFTG